MYAVNFVCLGLAYTPRTVVDVAGQVISIALTCLEVIVEVIKSNPMSETTRWNCT